MVALTLADVTVSRGSRVLVDGLSANFGPEACVGVFGPNGCGKTSLLKVIAGLHQLDAGAITPEPKDGVVGYLPQLRAVAEALTVGDVLRARTGVAAAQQAFDLACERLGNDMSAEATDNYDRALSRLEILGAESFEERAEQALVDVGFDGGLDRSVAGLSGGELGRVGLAGIGASRFQVLLLDEPTNDLDSDALAYLVNFVQAQAVPVMVVSHDRQFLRATVNSVLEFDPRLQQVTQFNGGYDAWRRESGRLLEAAKDENAEHQRRVSELEEAAAAQRQRAQAGVRSAKRAYASGRADKLQRSGMVEAATASGSGVRAIHRQLDRLEAPPEIRKVWQLQLRLPESERPSRGFVLDDVVLAAGPRKFGPFSLSIGAGEKVRVTGRNGAGKSVLIRALAGTIGDSGTATGGVLSGRISRPPLDDIGFVDQDRSLVPCDESQLGSWFAETAECSPADARTSLAKFGLGADDVTRPTATLSPGERTRAALAVLSVRPFGALLLDEITNHLDVPALEQVEKALSQYSGTLIFVTHDEDFADGVGFDQLIEL